MNRNGNALLNIELVNGNLKRLGQAWEETLMALEKEPKADLLDGLRHRQWERSTLSDTPASVVEHSVQLLPCVHRQ